ncbi:DUF397 domain-containing protein [Streptomyces sp. NBC_00885]|uniref:DUF397 domain-containing protein n=1 Tax=Streptomyces sp. NBC_00885 TaxID=2975857 RepID=UPI00386FA0C4|nr:DUF397 domain-containing protein [Streptomyces sp. NBC_00885]
MNTIPPLQWVKSSYSSPEGGNCLEWAPSVAAASGLVPVRDSKNPEGPALTFPADEWTHFVTFAKGQIV